MYRDKSQSDESDANLDTNATASTSHDRTGSDAAQDENFAGSLGDNIGNMAKSVGGAIGGVLGHEVFPSKGHPHTTDQADTTDSAGSMSSSAPPVGDVTGNAPWNGSEQQGNVNNSGPITADEGAILNPGTVGVDEEFAGTGGVGSAEYMEALHRGHQEAGGDYASDLSNPNTLPDTDGAQGRT